MIARTLLALSLLSVALAPISSGQSVYVDFGDPLSVYGVPPSTYGAACPPGTWNGVSATPALGLVDVNGAATGVALSVSAAPMLDACGNVATSGTDEALYDDRWAFDPAFVTLTVTGLAPGTYRVHVHVLIGTCLGMFSPLSVTIAGATPVTDFVDATPWNGQPENGVVYSTQYKTLGVGDALVLQTEAPVGFASYTQHCGLQVLRVDAPLAFCSGDGSGTPCPCANAGAPGRGCENSATTGGGLLRMTFGGLASVAHDSVELNASGLPSSASALYFQGTGMVAGGLGSTFGDGLVCVNGSVVRLSTKVSSAGSSSYPGVGDPSVSVRGLIPVGGGTRTYQVWYRNAAAFCTPEGFNLTNGLRLVWGP